jgi:hypothetical protein
MNTETDPVAPAAKTVSELKPGDWVTHIWHHSYPRMIRYFERVTAVTKTQIITGKPTDYGGISRWRRQDGHEFGERYSSVLIAPYSPDHKAEKEARELRQTLLKYIDENIGRRQDWEPAKLRAVAELLGWTALEATDAE